MSITIADVRAAVVTSTTPGAPFELADRTIDGRTFRVFAHAPSTLSDVLNAMRTHGGTEFVTFDGYRWTYRDFFTDADALAATMQRDLGVGVGDRVAIAMRNCADWLITFTAAAHLGAVIVPVNSWGSAAELDFTLRNSGASVLAADLPRLALSHATAAAMSIATLFSDVDGQLEDVPADIRARCDIVPIAAAVAAGRGRDYTPAGPDPADTALLLYTSGSTGHPKGVITRHVAVGQILMNMMFSGTVAAAAAAGDPPDAGLVAAQSHLITVPLFHATGLFGGFLLPGLLGHRIALLRKWHAETAMALIEAERITMLSSVPAIFKDLLTHPRFDDFDCSSIIRTSLGGAATPADLPDLMLAKLGVVSRGSGYGMTESGTVGSAMSGPIFGLKPFSAGILSPIIELRTAQPGSPLPPHAEGEIELRGVTVTPGYWRNEDQTREVFTSDGWLRTGDLGLVDDDGFLVITGRIKELVIRGGENIAPIEIENAAYLHADAKEVAVFGMPDDAMGEELAIVCHRQPGSALTAEQLRAHLRAQLPSFKVPRYVHVTDEPLPRNASEKIHRLAVKKSFTPRLG